jgi:hypothetical protein
MGPMLLGGPANSSRRKALCRAARLKTGRVTATVALKRLVGISAKLDKTRQFAVLFFVCP